MLSGFFAFPRALKMGNSLMLRKQILWPILKEAKLQGIQVDYKSKRSRVSLRSHLILPPDYELTWRNERYYMTVQGISVGGTLHDETDGKEFAKMMRSWSRLRKGRHVAKTD